MLPRGCVLQEEILPMEEEGFLKHSSVLQAHNRWGTIKLTYYTDSTLPEHHHFHASWNDTALQRVVHCYGGVFRLNYGNVPQPRGNYGDSWSLLCTPVYDVPQVSICCNGLSIMKKRLRIFSVWNLPTTAASFFHSGWPIEPLGNESGTPSRKKKRDCGRAKCCGRTKYH